MPSSTGITVMSRKNRVPLADRVARAAEAALAAQHFVSAVDILVGIGWLRSRAVKHWRRVQIGCLEEVIQANLPRISETMRLCESWAIARGLFPSPTAYVGRTPGRFSRGGVLRLRHHAGHIGFRPSFPARGASAWRKRQAAPRNWWWSSR